MQDAAIGLLLVKNYCLFGTHRGGQKGAIILADLFGHQVVEQGVHPQDRVFVFVALQSQVVQLVGILAEIEQLDVVVLEDLIERLRSIERGGGIVTRELVASIEHKGQESALAEVRVHLGERRQRLAAEDVLVGCKQIVSVDGVYTDVVEQHAWAVGMDIRGLGIAEQRGKIASRQTSDGGLPPRLRQPGHANERWQQVKVAGQRGDRLAASVGRMGDQKRYMRVELVSERTLAAQATMRTRHFAVVGGHHDDRILPQVEVVHRVNEQPEAASVVLDEVEVIVVKMTPHVRAVGRNKTKRASPPLVIFGQGRRHPRRRERLREAGNLSEVPSLLVDRVVRRRSDQ